MPEDYPIIQKWKASMFASFVQGLKAIPEGTGNMLDNSLVVMCSEMGEGSTHLHRNIPFVVAGKAGGTIRTGRYMNYGGVPLSRLLLSIAAAFGVIIPKLGSKGSSANPDPQTVPLDGLVA